MAHIKHSNPAPDYDPYKADIFSYGIVLLSVATCTPFENFYNFQAGNVNFENIKRKLVHIVDSRKSSEIFEFVDSCLKQNISERASLEQLYKSLPSVRNTMGSSVNIWKQ